MAIKFSLSLPVEKAFPTAVKNGVGEAFSIDTNYRTALKIMRLYGDEDVMEDHKLALLLNWFYLNETPPDVMEAIHLMNAFIRNAGDEDEEIRRMTPQFDYEFDSEEIYVSFISDYQIDLYETEYMHWHKFQMLLVNLSMDSPFQRKIQLRFADLKGLKGEQHSKAVRAKRRVQIPQKFTREEEAAIKNILEQLK